MTDKTQYISDRAYYLWEQAGRPAGREQEFWLQAEAEYQHGMTQPVPPRTKKAANTTAKETVRKATTKPAKKAAKKPAKKSTNKKK